MDVKLYNLLGGVGLLIYSLSMLSLSSQHLFTSWFHKKFNHHETNRFKSLLQGLIFSFITESSRISTITFSGLIDSTNINFLNIYYFIAGANIGASLIPLLVLLNVSIIPYLFAFLGTILVIFINKSNKLYKHFGELLLSLGLLLISISFIKQGYYDHPLIELIKNNSFSSFFTGIIFAFIFRGSNANIILVAPLVSIDILNLKSAFFIVVGSNIGSSLFVLYRAYRSERHTKITAFMHFILNILGSLAIISIYLLAGNKLVYITNIPLINILLYHIILNILGAILVIIFANAIISSLRNSIFSFNNAYEPKVFKYINPLVVETPSMAIEQCIKELVRMGEMSLTNLEKAFSLMFDYRRDIAQKIQKDEEVIDYLEDALMNFLTNLSMHNPTYKESETILTLYNLISDMERVGDHAINILGLAEYKFNHYISFSEEATVELKYLYELAFESFKKALKSLSERSINLANEVKTLEDKIDSVEKQLRQDHIDRLNKCICKPTSGMVFLDTLTNLERVGDHANKVALTTIDILNYLG
ncbi:MAG: Na/Pi symporter [Clostridiales bacterium]|nr:Na/Pi symporter [Clostridiales bacterium]